MKIKLILLITVSITLFSCNEARVDEFVETPSENNINSDSLKQLEKSRGSLKDGKIPTH